MPRRTCRWCGERAGSTRTCGSTRYWRSSRWSAFSPRWGAPTLRAVPAMRPTPRPCARRYRRWTRTTGRGGGGAGGGEGGRAGRAGVRVVCVEPLGERRVAETIAREVGGTTAMLNPLESLTVEAQRAGKNYFTVMHENLDQLAQGLD